METVTPTVRIVIMAVVLSALTATAGIWLYRDYAKTPLTQMLRVGMPVLPLTIVFRDADNHVIAGANTLFGSDEPAPPGKDDTCTRLIGGDNSAATEVSAWDKYPDTCPRHAVWYVRKAPILATLSFNDGDKVLQWWDSNANVKTLRDSRFVQGLLAGWINSMKIKAEQLQLTGLQGELLTLILRDALAADAELHYDLAHGRKGWVLSYQRRKAEFTEQALPVLLGVLANKGFQPEKLNQPVVAMRIGTQNLFLTEYERRLYWAQSLEALLNVLASLEKPQQPLSEPLSITLRAEALVQNLIPVFTGSEQAPIRLGFSLDDELGRLTLPAGAWQKPLHDQLFAGVLASIPHDAFAAVAASYQVPPTLTANDWRNLSATSLAKPQQPAQAGGIALVWDFDGQNSDGDIGIIIANPDKPQAAPGYRQYLQHPDLAEECAGGSVFLAATSANLLTRLKDACAKQSLSPLDWQKGQEKQRYLSAQLVSFINPGSALKALMLSGGAGSKGEIGDFAPRWQQQYEQAKAAMRADGDKLFTALPILSYAGRADGGEVDLIGQFVAQ